MIDWLSSHYGLLRQVWVVVLGLLFLGIVFWVFRPRNKERLESKGRIPLDDERGGPPRR